MADDIFSIIGGVVAGAGKTAGDFIAGLIKPSVEQIAVPTIKQVVTDITPVIREQTTQVIRDTLPVLRQETVSFIGQAGSATAQATQQNIAAALPFIAIAGIVVVAAARR